jgi:hypothetical protein
MDQKLTDRLTEAAATWTTLALRQLNAKRSEVVNAIYADPDADFHVTIQLKQGTVILEGVNERIGQRIEVFRQERPLRSQTAFGDERH